MSVRPGYKQTEVGVIPADWSLVLMGALGSFSKGQGIRKDEASSGEIPCIRYGEIYTHHQDIVRFFNSRISRAVAATSKRLKQGDLLFAGSGETKEEIGKCIAFIGCEEAYAGGDIVILSPYSADSEFLGYLFNAPFIVRQKASKGQGDAVVHISATALASVRAPIPAEVSEQRAIAAALSDVDALLAKLDQFIAKKRDLKQAAMQQLLTGQTRLPGFSGEWEVKRLGELLAYEQPTKYLVSSSEYSDSNDVPVLTAGKTFVLGFTNESEGIFADLPAIIFDDFTTATKYVTFPFKAKSSAMKILKPRNPSVNLRLVYEIMQLIEFKLGDHKRYWISEYSKLELKLPEAAEQTAIATVLSDMDVELEVLETRRDKTRALKQGMMQELLAGRIRLV